MARYRMDDSTIVDTENATGAWGCRNVRGPSIGDVCVHTNSETEHEHLYRSRKNRYYLVHESLREGRQPRAEWVSRHAAAAWLMLNGNPIPPDLADVVDDVVE